MESEKDNGEWLLNGAWPTTIGSSTAPCLNTGHRGGEEGLRVMKEGGGARGQRT